MKEYTNSQISAVIDEYIHSQRNRAILKRRYVDGITYERIADELMTTLQVLHPRLYDGVLNKL